MTVNTPPQSPSPRIASPDLSETHDQRPHSYGNLFDETLDTPFSFYTSITDNMEDYLVGTPEPHGQHDAQDASNNTRPVTPKKTDDNREHTGDVVMSPGEGHMSRLSLGDHSHTHTTPYHHQVTQPPLHMAPPYYGYSMYGQFPLSTGPPEQHSPHYHPYKTYPFGMRSPKSGRLSLPHEPLSPPLSISPPESPGSHHQLALLHTPPSAVSPSLVSPASAIGSTLSDVSPDSGGWTYPLPTQTGGYAATPLTSIHGLPQGSPTAPGLAMVAGYPYPSVSPRHAPPRRVSGRVTRGKAAAVAKQKGDSATKHEKFDDDDDSDLDDIGSPAPRSSGGLGLVPQEHRTILGSKREDVRKMRIESEQRRRDELREGFARLKDGLPQSNQRSSKASLLDRSVQYIRDIDFANRYLSTENDALKAELAEVRQSNQELVHAMTVQSRTTSSPNGQA